MPPFIGLVPVSEPQRQSAFQQSKNFLGGDPGRISSLFGQFPYVSTWCVAKALSENYGELDNAIYRHLEDRLGVPLVVQRHREILFDRFCCVCNRLGLPTHGFSRMVDVYLLHAGVPIPILPRLIQGFLRQEAAFGPPPTEATVMLNRWEDDSLTFLPPSVVTPRRAILWDETAWHAALFAKIRQNPDAFVAKYPIEKRFRKILEDEVGKDRPPSKGGGSNVVGASPKLQLIWNTHGLTVRAPRVVGHIRLWLDEDISPYNLRGGEDWVLPEPWPAHLRWNANECRDELDFLVDPEALAIFDCMSGRVVKELKGQSGDFEIETTDTVILSRREFSVEGEPALETRTSSFIAYTQLGYSPIVLQTQGGEVRLRAKPRRSLTIRGGIVASGPSGRLYGPSAMVEVNTGFERDELRRLRLSVGKAEAEAEINVVRGLGEISIDTLFSEFRDVVHSDPVRMRIDLLAPSHGLNPPGTTGISIQSLVWPAFAGGDGLVYRSNPAPRNFVLKLSQNVTQDSRGRLSLDVSGGYVLARAVFEIDGDFVPFDLPWPDVVVIRRRSEDGSELGLPLNTRLTVDEHDRFDTISIRCPDPQATLRVRGQREDHPFARGLSRNLAVRYLLEATTDSRVILRRANGNELLLFEIVSSVEPLSVQRIPTVDGLRLRLNLMRRMDALALEVERESGKTEFVEASLGRRPVSTRRPSWLKVELIDGDPTQIQLTVTSIEFDDGLVLARLFLRPEAEAESQSTWHPLRNSRGETYAILFGDANYGSVDMDTRKRFKTLCGWLADCYAADCWSAIKTPLISRWKEVGRSLLAQPGGTRELMMAGAIAPPDHTSRNWIPVMHPIHIFPGLYGASTATFASLSGSLNTGMAELARLYSLGQARLRDQSQLHGTVYLAFRNSLDAEKYNVPLREFDACKFFRNLQIVDNDPSAGWFWRGTPVLGPDHWRASHRRFVDRLRTAGMFSNLDAEAGANSRRQEDLNRLSRLTWELTPDDERPRVPLRSADHTEPYSIDLWIAACLSMFARASRTGEADELVAKLGHKLGWSNSRVLCNLAVLLRLAPELFTFFLLTWQIAKDRP